MDRKLTPDAARAYRDRSWQPVMLHGLRDDGQTCTCSKATACGRRTAKHPVDDGWQNAPMPTEKDIEQNYHCRLNVGIVTGQASGLLVLDIDPDSGGDATMAALMARYGRLPTTYSVRTGSGGQHLYFTMPDFNPGNTVRKLGPGLDTRGDGGQVVAPPSRTAKGPYTVQHDVPVVAAPAWLLDLLRPADRPAPERGEPLPPRAEWIAAAVRGNLDRLDAMEAAGTSDGRGYQGEPWDRTTFVVACRLIELANTDAGYPLDQAEADLFAHAPSDAGFGPDRHAEKWKSAAHTVGSKAATGPGVQAQAEPDAKIRAALEFQTFAELCAEVAAAGPRRWLLRGWWPAGDYGVHGAAWKAQKTWNAVDLAVSVASGTDWLGAVPVDDPGPVLTFLGEGGKANYVRRMRAICDSRGLRMENLPGAVCARAPHLSDDLHLALMRAQVEELKPKLVIIDPLYLAASGADGKNLYAMGAILERPQHLCASIGAALLVVTHFNRNRDGRGSARLTGAGPAEWGRVLITAEIVSNSTDEQTKESTIVTDLDAIGGEIPEQGLRIRRRIVAADPDDLNSPLSYTVETLPRNDCDKSAGSADLSPAEQKLLAAITDRGEPSTNKQLVDWIAEKHGHGLRRETVSRSLNALLTKGYVERTEPPRVGGATLWTLPTGLPDADEAGVTSHVTSHSSRVRDCDGADRPVTSLTQQSSRDDSSELLAPDSSSSTPLAGPGPSRAPPPPADDGCGADGCGTVPICPHCRVIAPGATAAETLASPTGGRKLTLAEMRDMILATSTDLTDLTDPGAQPV